MTNSKQLSLPTEGESKIDLFRKQEIRKILHEKEWWFSVKDVLEVLTDTKDGTRYASDLRKKDPGLNERYSEITRALPFASSGGKQNTTFTSIEGLFRIMQSVPTAKAEPFKKWLAKVGFERLQEIQNPELAVKRAFALYRAKGYDDEWIDARITNKASREMLTSEWDKRGMTKYIGILTDAISVETFGIGVQNHRQIKGLKLKSQNLRDNMTPIELTLTTLGEQATTEIVKSTNPLSLDQHKLAAVKGGGIAGAARKQIEDATGKSVISSTNYLTSKQRQNNALRSKSEFNIFIPKILNQNKKNHETSIDNIIEVPQRATQNQLIELSKILKENPGQNKIAIHLPNGKLISLGYGVNFNQDLINKITKILKTSN